MSIIGEDLKEIKELLEIMEVIRKYLKEQPKDKKELLGRLHDKLARKVSELTKRQLL